MIFFRNRDCISHICLKVYIATLTKALLKNKKLHFGPHKDLPVVFVTGARNCPSTIHRRTRGWRMKLSKLRLEAKALPHEVSLLVRVDDPASVTLGGNALQIQSNGEPRVARVAGAGGWLPAHQGSSLGLAWCLTGVFSNFSRCRFCSCCLTRGCATMVRVTCPSCSKPS